MDVSQGPLADLAAAAQRVHQMDREDRATRFAKRIDGHLAGLPNDQARLEFLEQQLERWEALYAQFMRDAALDRVDTKPGAPSAYDYVFTICDLSLRQSRVSRAIAEARHG